MRFGIDPASGSLDVMCQAHDREGRYVTDTSSFPSTGATNPFLTDIA